MADLIDTKQDAQSKPDKLRRRGFLGRSGPVIPGAPMPVDSGFDKSGLGKKLASLSADDASRAKALQLLKDALKVALVA